MDIDDFVRAYEAAVANEQASWGRAKDKLPGMEGFDPRLWKEWKNAVQISCAAQEVLTTVLEQNQRN